MASSTGEEPPSSPVQPIAPSMDAKLMVVTEKPHPEVIDPLLLALACTGSFKKLQSLLNGEGNQASGNCTNGSQAMQPASDDVEAFLKESLLEGVTVGGDTALHAVATYGDGDDFVASADIIYIKAKHLLFVQNKKGDTPLHCAARAGRFQMVSSLVRLVKDEEDGVNKLKKLLEKENKLKETALHEAIRSGNNEIVELLMNEDPGLACFPKDGTSPLYLAVLLENNIIATTLHQKSNGNLSYSGPDGQNALHAAALRWTGMAGKLLTWNEDLTQQADQNGSTPLHFAASLSRVEDGWLHNSPARSRSLSMVRGGFYWTFRRGFPWISRAWRPGCPLEDVLRANPQQLYQSDNKGLFPVHVAASAGAVRTLVWILNKYPGCAGLRDDKGRTFLHIAVEKRRVTTVRYACRNRSLSWILNMQDKNGNTALHLAVQAGSLRMFCALFENVQAYLNITNEKGQTLLDISKYNFPRGMYYTMNSEALIRRTLLHIMARTGNCREDHFEEKYPQQVKRDKREETDRLKDSTQTLCIGSVLIATVTFGATFALPGGYRADDHVNGGTPTLAGRYIFHAFMMANTLAFICSSVATIGLMYAGASMVHLQSRQINLSISVLFMSSSVTSLTIAFALGVYMVLSPVARNTAIAICVISPLVVIYRNMETLIKLALLAGPICIRMSFFRALQILAGVDVAMLMFIEFWPFVVIFGWAAFAWTHQHH